MDHSLQPVETAISPSVGRILARLGLSEAKSLSSTSTEQIVAVLQDSRWERRASAATALSRFDIVGSAYLFTMALGDEHEAVRAAAVRVLGQRGDTASIMWILSALQDPHPFVREAAATALGKVSLPGSLDPLIAASKDEHEEVRAAAIQALGQREDITSITRILSALQDPHPFVREAAAIALEICGNRNVHVRLSLLHCFLQDEEILVRDAITQTLFMLEPDATQNFIQFFLQEQEHLPQEIVGAAIKNLIDLGLNAHERIASIIPLVIALQNVDKRIQKVTTLYLIGRGLDMLNERIPIAPLIEILLQSRQERKTQEGIWRALHALAQETLRDHKITRLLLAAVHDQDPIVREEITHAVDWLIQLAFTLREERMSEDQKTFDQLRSILREQSHPAYETTLSTLVKHALTALEEREPTEVLLANLNDPDAQKRREVGQKLAKRAQKAHMARIPGGPLIISLKKAQGLTPVELQFGGDQENMPKEGRPIFPWDGPISPRLTLPALPNHLQSNSSAFGSICSR